MRFSATKRIHVRLLVSVCLTVAIFLSSGMTASSLTPPGALKAKQRANVKRHLKKAANFDETRADFLTAKKELKELRDEKNEAKFEEHAARFLEKVVDKLIQRLDKLKTWVGNRKALDEGEKQAIIADLNADIATLNSKASALEGASPEQIRQEAKELRAYWKNHRVIVKRVVGQILAGRIDKLISKAENFSNRVSAKIEKLEAEGEDTSELKSLLSDFSDEIALAKTKHEAAKSKFQSISNWEEAKQLWREGHELIKEAHQSIKDAHANLVKIVSGLKES